MSGLKIIPFGRRKAESAVADTHLAEARCQEARPAFRDNFFFVKIRSYFVFLNSSFFMPFCIVLYRQGGGRNEKMLIYYIVFIINGL